MIHQFPQPEPATLILIDELDRASLTLTPAIEAMATLEYMLAAMPDEYALTGRELANLLRCVNQTARQGWPMGDANA